MGSEFIDDQNVNHIPNKIELDSQKLISAYRLTSDIDFQYVEYNSTISISEFRACHRRYPLMVTILSYSLPSVLHSHESLTFSSTLMLGKTTFCLNTYFHNNTIQIPEANL